MQHLSIPTRNWYITWDNRRYHCLSWEKIICNIYMCQPWKWYIYWDGFPLYATLEIFLSTEKSSLLTEIFYQFLYTNWYFLSTTLILPHKHTQRQTRAYIQIHTSLRVPFSSLNFCFSNLEFGYFNSLK